MPHVMDVVEIRSNQRNKFKKQIDISLVYLRIEKTRVSTIKIQVRHIAHNCAFKRPKLTSFLVQPNANSHIHNIILALDLCQIAVTLTTKTH